MSLAKSRAEAIERGEIYYLEIKPCPKGHIYKRHIHGGCAQCRYENNLRYREQKIKTDFVQSVFKELGITRGG